MKTTTIGPAEKPIRCKPGPTRRLLLVDDDPTLRELVDEMVRGWSFAPSLAANFREARTAVVTEEPFSVIVSDYHLPDGNGLEFLDWLNREMLVKVPFLLISGGMNRAPAATDDYAFLAKPFLMDEFHSRLEELSCLKPQPDPSFSLTAAQKAMASVYALKRPRR